MAKEVTTTSEDGFASFGEVSGHRIDIDATGEETPDTVEYLLATHAACYVPALRVGAEQRDAGDLGTIDIMVTGETNDSDKLESIAFDVSVTADVNSEQAQQIIQRANEICKVQDALKDGLRPTVTLNGHSA